MKGWLIVNSFLKTEKFLNIYKMLQNSCSIYNIDLKIITSDYFIGDINDDFKNVSLPNFVIFWDKDVYLAKRLELCGVKVFNSANAIEICDNKILTALSLTNKVKTPKTIFAPKTFENVNYNNKDFLVKASKVLGFPFIIKEAFGSFGQQVYLVENLQQAILIVDKLKHKDFLMQEFISTSYGKDVRINVVGNKVVSSMLRINNNDFRSNISNGGSFYKYEPTPSQINLALDTCRLLGLDFAGVDVLFGENDEPILCEVNSNPNFYSSFECNGIDLSKEIINYIVGKLK